MNELSEKFQSEKHPHETVRIKGNFERVLILGKDNLYKN